MPPDPPLCPVRQGVMKCLNVNKLTKAGCTFKFWVADWRAPRPPSPRSHAFLWHPNRCCRGVPPRRNAADGRPLGQPRRRFALMNNKMGGDLKKIQTVGQYMVEARCRSRRSPQHYTCSAVAPPLRRLSLGAATARAPR